MNTFSQGTDTWKKVTEGLKITAYDPAPFTTSADLEFVEPGSAVNLSEADRTRMNRAMPGVRTRPERP
jgi:hypothetical protein